MAQKSKEATPSNYSATIVEASRELSPKERRIIDDGTLFTLGATSIILRSADNEEEKNS